VAVGDKIPNVELMEGSPGNKVNIAQELEGKGLVIGELPTCSKEGRTSPDQVTAYRSSRSFLPRMLGKPHPRLYQLQQT
jgi:hypothetical protein